jgi:hypothetical protein
VGIAPEHEASPGFPDIKFPRETAAACLAAAAKWLADSGLSVAAVPAPDEEDGWVPGEALAARDAYGSRFLLAVPFSSGEAPGEGGRVGAARALGRADGVLLLAAPC